MPGLGQSWDQVATMTVFNPANNQLSVFYMHRVQREKHRYSFNSKSVSYLLYWPHGSFLYLAWHCCEDSCVHTRGIIHNTVWLQGKQSPKY